MPQLLSSTLNHNSLQGAQITVIILGSRDIQSEIKYHLREKSGKMTRISMKRYFKTKFYQQPLGTEPSQGLASDVPVNEPRSVDPRLVVIEHLVIRLRCTFEAWF